MRVIWVPGARTSDDTSGARIAGRMVGEPLRDARHVLLEIARGRDIEHPGTFRAAVLEVMGHVARGTTTNDPVLASIHSVPTSTLIVPART